LRLEGLVLFGSDGQIAQPPAARRDDTPTNTGMSGLSRKI